MKVQAEVGSEASTSQRMARAAISPRREGGQGIDSSLKATRGSQPCRQLDCGVLVSRTVREEVSGV